MLSLTAEFLLHLFTAYFGGDVEGQGPNESEKENGRMKKLIGMLVMAAVVALVFVGTGCASLGQVGTPDARKGLANAHGEFPQTGQTFENIMGTGRETHGPCEFILVWRGLNEDDKGGVHVGKTESQIFRYGELKPGTYIALEENVGEGSDARKEYRILPVEIGD